jgi:hypothetical protein
MKWEDLGDIAPGNTVDASTKDEHVLADPLAWNWVKRVSAMIIP